jgi:hypothetical protein
METNEAAIQQYEESLPPKNEAQILENDAAAHQKHQESPFPEMKAQILILEINAGEQQKHLDSLTP